MPLYSYECSDCGGTRDEFRRIADRNDCPTCELCKKPMRKLLGGHSVVPDLQPYFDENLDCAIKSKQHRKQVMRDQGVEEKFGTHWHTGFNNKTKRHIG